MEKKDNDGPSVYVVIVVKRTRLCDAEYYTFISHVFCIAQSRERKDDSINRNN